MRTFNLLVCSFLLSGTCLAHALSGSPWKELAFKNEDGDEVRIKIDNKRHAIDAVNVRSATCEGGFSDIPVPGIIDLNGVEFLEDQDDVGKINVLTIHYLLANEGEGTVSLPIRDCRLINKETY